MSNTEESDGDNDDYKENEHSNICNQFTLEEMKNIIEWCDQHINAKLSTIFNRFKKIKSMKNSTRLRDYRKQWHKIRKLYEIT